LIIRFILVVSHRCDPHLKNVFYVDFVPKLRIYITAYFGEFSG